jgi:hypothetical protein
MRAVRDRQDDILPAIMIGRVPTIGPIPFA